MANTVGGTDLYTAYRLKLSSLQGDDDLPEYKKIVDEHDHSSTMKVCQEKEITVKLIGTYDDITALVTYIGAFRIKITGSMAQTWAFSDHGFSESCIIKDGVSIKYYRDYSVEIDFKLVIAG